MSQSIIYGNGSVILTPTLNGDGTAIAVPTPVRMRDIQNISGLDFKYDTKDAHGDGQFPLYGAKGKGSFGFSFETLSQTINQINVAHGQTVTTGREVLYEDTTGSAIPGTPYAITPTPPNSGVWVSDQGVYDALTGDPLVRVASAPITGQYSVSAGVYTFAAADTTKTVYIDYLYSISTGKKLTLNSQKMGFTPFYSALLTVKYQDDGLLFNFKRIMVKSMSTGTKKDDFEMIKYECAVYADPITKAVGSISLKV